MKKPTIAIIDCLTNELVTREMTLEEVAEYEKMVANPLPDYLPIEVSE